MANVKLSRIGGSNVRSSCLTYKYVNCLICPSPTLRIPEHAILGVRRSDPAARDASEANENARAMSIQPR